MTDKAKAEEARKTAAKIVASVKKETEKTARTPAAPKVASAPALSESVRLILKSGKPITGTPGKNGKPFWVHAGEARAMYSKVEKFLSVQKTGKDEIIFAIAAAGKQALAQA